MKIKPNNSWEIEKLNLVKEISKAMSYDYSEYDAMSNNDTPEEVAVNLLDDFITKTLQQQREEIIKEIEGIVKDEWEDPDIRGSKIEDTGSYAVTNPVVRNELRKEIRERLKQI